MIPRAVLYYADQAPLQDSDSEDEFDDEEESDSDSEDGNHLFQIALSEIYKTT